VIDLPDEKEVFTHRDRAGENVITFIFCKEKIMSQPFTFHAVNNRSASRIGQVLFTVLALLALVLGSLLLSLAWFGVGVTPGLEAEARGMAFIIVWPVTMLVVWICSTIASLLGKRLGKRRIVVSFSLPVAFVIMMGVWALVAFFMITISAMIFTTMLILLNIGAIWLAAWFLRSASR
jgi:CDP-diglyceride synthetase